MNYPLELTPNGLLIYSLYCHYIVPIFCIYFEYIIYLVLAKTGASNIINIFWANLGLVQWSARQGPFFELTPIFSNIFDIFCYFWGWLLGLVPLHFELRYHYYQ